MRRYTNLKYLFKSLSESVMWEFTLFLIRRSVRRSALSPFSISSDPSLSVDLPLSSSDFCLLKEDSSFIGTSPDSKLLLLILITPTDSSLFLLYASSLVFSKCFWSSSNFIFLSIPSIILDKSSVFTCGSCVKGLMSSWLRDFTFPSAGRLLPITDCLSLFIISLCLVLSFRVSLYFLLFCSRTASLVLTGLSFLFLSESSSSSFLISFLSVSSFFFLSTRLPPALRCSLKVLDSKTVPSLVSVFPESSFGFDDLSFSHSLGFIFLTSFSSESSSYNKKKIDWYCVYLNNKITEY